MNLSTSTPVLTNAVDFPKENIGLNQPNLNEPKLNEPVVVPLPDNVANQNMADLYKRRIIRLGLATAAAMQIMKVGGVLFEHSVAFYAYVQYSPKTLWGQYFYANATHEAAKKILSTTLLGCSISSVMTSALAVRAGVVVAKSGAAIYNCCVDKDKKISIGLSDMVSDIFSLVFRDTLI
jgi:hypothetical protein